MSKNSSIQKLLFDINFSSREKVHELQNRISGLHSARLSGLLKSFFDERVSADILLKVNTVTLDLGTISYNNMENEISERLLVALADNFEGPFPLFDGDFNQRNVTIEVMPVEKSYLNLFKTFLLTGSLPWSASFYSISDLQEKLGKLFLTQPQQLQTLVLHEGRYDFVRRRLAYQFKPVFINRLIHLLEPEGALFIVNYNENIRAVHHKEPVVKTDEESFNKEVWFFILTYLIKEKGSLFSKKEFVKSSFKQMAARFNIGYGEVLMVFNKALQTTKLTVEKAELISLIKIVSEEELSNISKKNASKKESSDRGFEEMQWLRYFFKNGSIPEANIENAAALNGLFLAMVQQHREEVKQILKTFAPDLVRARIYSFAGKKGIEEIIKLFFPSSAEECVLFTRVLQSSVLKRTSARNVSIEKELQKILIEYIFSNRDYNNKALLTYTINRLSDVIKVKREQLARLFLEEFQNSKDNILSLHQKASLIDELRSKISATAVDTQAPVINLQDIKEEEEPVNSDNIFDLLTHFITTGTLPWWASKNNVSLKDLLQQLLNTSPSQAMLLLRSAGRKEAFIDRVLLQFPVTELLAVFNGLAVGKKAVAAFHFIKSQFVEAGFLHTEQYHQLRLSLIKILWLNFIEGQYETFNEPLFYIRSVNEAVNIYHLSPEEIVEPLAALLVDNEQSFLLSALSLSLAEKMHGPGYENVSTLFSNQPEEPVLLEGFAKDLLAELTLSNPSSKQETLLYEVLDYFFIKGNFTGYIKPSVGLAPELYLKIFITLLFRLNPDALVVLLEKHYFRPGMPALLNKLFSMEVREEKEVLLILKKIFYKLNPLLPVADANVESSKNGYPDSREVLPLVKKYFETGQINKNGLKDEAVRILDHFLASNHLPEANSVTSDFKINDILREIIVFMYHYEKASLHALLTKTNRLAEAKISLHILFNTSVAGEKAIALFLEPYLKPALLEYLWEDETLVLKVYPAKESVSTPLIFDDISTYLQPSKDDNESANVNEPTVAELTETLGYFLIHNRLPDAVKIPVAGQGHFVKKAAVLLFHKNSDVLKSLLQKQGHNIKARIHLHDLILSQPPAPSSDIVILMRGFLHSDMLTYVNEHKKASSPDAYTSMSHSVKAFTLTSSAQEARSFISALSVYDTTIQYVAQALDNNAFYALLEKADSNWAKNFSSFGIEVKNIFAPALNGNDQHELFANIMKEFMLRAVSGNIIIKDRFEYLTKFFEYLDKRQPAFVNGAYKKLQRLSPESIMFSAPGLNKQLRKELSKRVIFQHQNTGATIKAPASKIPETQKENTPDEKSLSLKTAAKKILSQNDKDLKYADGEKPQVTIDEGSKLYVHNAGLVLLHPFIQTFFSLNGLTKERKFVDEDSRRRAVLLLQYLVYGTTEFEEPELVLNKILCGMALEEAVPQNIIVTDKEAATAAELFKIIFQQWDKAKNSSVEGFRNSFLKREASLLYTAEGWTMRVEQKGYDLVLQTLPWTFSLVKFIWMDRPLMVEWI